MNIKETISKRPWILAVAVAAIAAMWMGSGWVTDKPELLSGTSQISSPGTDEGLTPVQLQTMQAENIVRIFNVYGRTEPSRTVELAAETEGRVEKINARRGVQVRVGAPLLTMDMRDRSARFDQARASVIEHRTSYQGQLKLQKDGYVSDTQIAETLAKLEAAKTELVRAELDMDNRIIRAPFNGTLQEREVEVGDFVRSGDKVATFVDNTKIIVIGSVAEQAAVSISPGDKAIAKLITGEQVEGAIRYIAPVADIATRTFQVEMEIPNRDGRLPAGVTAELLLPGGEILAHKISPALLTLDPDGNVGVKTVDPYDRVEFHTVNIERSDTDGIWVSGLPETANIITVGQGYVAAGQRVSGIFPDSETALAAKKGTSENTP